MWNCGNKRKKLKKEIGYVVPKSLKFSEMGSIFETWSTVQYMGYKSMTHETDWCSLIRQKANNIYTRYCDSDVILQSDYMKLLHTPKILFMRWMSGEHMNPYTVTKEIDDAIAAAEDIRKMCKLRKMDLSWDDYKKIMNGFFERIFSNCALSEDFENGDTVINIYDFQNEDTLYVKYFCKCMDGYMANFQKEFYSLKRGRNKKYTHCKICGRLIEKTNNRIMYCRECAVVRDKENAKIRMKKHRKNDVTI